MVIWRLCRKFDDEFMGLKRARGKGKGLKTCGEPHLVAFLSIKWLDISP